MKPLTKHSGIVALLNRVDVDTDQIIPKNNFLVKQALWVFFLHCDQSNRIYL